MEKIMRLCAIVLLSGLLVFAAGCGKTEESKKDSTEESVEESAKLTVYVSNSGNDADPGTKEKPVASLAKGYELLSAMVKADAEANKDTLGTLMLEGEFNIDKTFLALHTEGFTLNFDSDNAANAVLDFPAETLKPSFHLRFGNVTLSGEQGAVLEHGGTTAKVIIGCEEGNALIMKGALSVYVQTFSGGGKLTMNNENSLIITTAELESTEVVFSAQPENGKTIITTNKKISSALFYSSDETFVADCSGANKMKWGIYVTEELKECFKIQVPAETTFSLCSDLDAKIEVTPLNVYGNKDGIVYYYKDLKEATYMMKSDGNSVRYSFTQPLSYTKEKAGTTVVLDSGKMSGDGYEQTSSIKRYTEEFEENALSSSVSDWEELEKAGVFSTPAFSNKERETGSQQATTYEQMIAFIKEKTDACKNAYVYTYLTTPGYKLDNPCIVLTTSDLSGAKTYQEAAEIVNKNGKLTLMMLAQIHGNEPASGEAALAELQSLCGEYGVEILEKINIVMVPRVNPDGAQNFTRNDEALKHDMNRDHIASTSEEITAIHELYFAFMPEAVIDQHEYNGSNTVVSNSTCHDLIISTGGTNNNDSGKIHAIGLEVIKTALDEVYAGNLRGHIYTSPYSTNATNPSTGRVYYSLTGAVPFLIESRGIGSGLMYLERRVAGQYIAATAMIEYIAANASTFIETVRAEREYLAGLADSYSTDKQVVLETAAGTTTPFRIVKVNYLTGKVVSDTTVNVNTLNKTVKSRPRALGYAVSKDNSGYDAIIATLKNQGIEYTEIAPGTTMKLQQYKVSSNYQDALTEEKEVTFVNGGIYVPMQTVKSGIIQVMFEPDWVDGADYKPTFVQRKLIDSADGLYDLYRSIRVE